MDKFVAMNRMRLFLALVMLCGSCVLGNENDISPVDIEFRRQAVRRLVFDMENAIPLASLRACDIVNMDVEHPRINLSGTNSVYSATGGLLKISADAPSESAVWVGGFNPFATYDVSFDGGTGENAEAGVEFATPDNNSRLALLAGFVNESCHNLRLKVVVNSEEYENRIIKLNDPVKGPFTLRVQFLGTGINVFIEKNGVSRVAHTYDFSKLIDLRRKEHIRSFEFRLLTKLGVGDSVTISKTGAFLTTGVGQADLRAMTYQDGSPILDQGRVWITMTLRGRGLPHPVQGVFSLNPSVFDLRLEGIIAFDRDDGLLRNEVASHIFFDQRANEWRGFTTGFSAYGDPDSKVGKQLWAVSSKRDPRFGFSIMKSQAVRMPGAQEDPHVIYDSEAAKWRVLVCAEGQVGFPAALYEAEMWNGPYELIAGPASVNGTGCLLQKFGSKRFALFGSADRKFYVYSYPELKEIGALDMARPPWNSVSNTRCWPNVIPLPEGYPAPYIALTMDRANYPDLKGWTYGAVYLYHGHLKSKRSD